LLRADPSRFKDLLALELELQPPTGPVRRIQGRISLVHTSGKGECRWNWILLLDVDEPDVPDGTIIRARAVTTT
jgi:hypothetical protein